MKKIIIFSIILTLTNNLFAQNQSITKFWGKANKQERVYNIYEVNNNSFFVTAIREYNGNIMKHESLILKLDSNCNVTDSLKLIKYTKRGKIYFMSQFNKYNNDNLGFGYAYDTVTQKFQLWLSKYDDDLNLINDTVFENESTSDVLQFSTSLLTSDNKLLVLLFYYPDLHDTTNTLVFLIDSNFNKVKSNALTLHPGWYGAYAVEVSSTQSYHIITDYDITKINKSDLSFDTVIWRCNVDPYSNGCSGAKSINDSTYIHPVSHAFYNMPFLHDNQDTYLFIRNKDAISIDTLYIRDFLQSYEKAAFNNIDFYTTDSIFVCGTNYSLDSSNFSAEDNTIFLWNIKLNGQINWQKYYGCNKRINVIDIKKTSDGGCFIVGNAWDWHHSLEPMYDVYLLKVDRNGIISGSMGINDMITQNEIIVYPNPAKDYLNFNMGMYKDFKLSVYNQLGQLMVQKQFTSGINSISVQDFKQGIYFYKLLNKNGKVISGKFVKE